MPPTIGLFVNPGHHGNPADLDDLFQSSNRSFEYDRLGEQYAQFLMQELIPEVAKAYVLILYHENALL